MKNSKPWRLSFERVVMCGRLTEEMACRLVQRTRLPSWLALAFRQRREEGSWAVAEGKTTVHAVEPWRRCRPRRGMVRSDDLGTDTGTGMGTARTIRVVAAASCTLEGMVESAARSHARPRPGEGGIAGRECSPRQARLATFAGVDSRAVRRSEHTGGLPTLHEAPHALVEVTVRCFCSSRR